MEKTTKSSKNIPIRKIFEQYWIGTESKRTLLSLSVAFFFVAQVVRVVIPIFYKKFFDLLSSSTNPGSDVNNLVHIIYIVLGLNIVSWVSWRVGVNMYNVMESRVMAKLKQNAFNYLTRHSYTFFANTFGGSLVQKIGRFSRAFEAILDTLVFNLMPLLIAIFGSIYVTWTIVPVVSLMIIAWVIVFVVFSFVFSNWKLKYDEISAKADTATTAYLSDAITNSTAMSFFTGHEHESNGFKDVTQDQANKTLFSWRLGDVVDAVQTLLILIIEFFVFYYAVRYWKSGLATVGTFVLIQSYIIGLANQLWGLNRIIRNLYQSIADSKEMVEILITPYEIQDKPDAKDIVVKNGEIKFENVTFNFGKGEDALKEINLTIGAGEKVAVVGHSGAGKTTLVRLIMRLYNITSGHLYIDNQDIEEVTQDSLRNNISFVPQDPILFHRTLMENIRYGKRDATDEEVIQASKLAHCDDFIDKLPLKYDTYVGERGIKLSGGERQRVAIARALLKKAPILIFDEATSSLDSYSESLIQDALENLMKNSTTIVIAHRLSTIKRMDRIISMDEGRIVEIGTHEELAHKENGLYKKLWDLQVGGFV